MFSKIFIASLLVTASFSADQQISLASDVEYLEIQNFDPATDLDLLAKSNVPASRLWPKEAPEDVVKAELEKIFGASKYMDKAMAALKKCQGDRTRLTGVLRILADTTLKSQAAVTGAATGAATGATGAAAAATATGAIGAAATGATGAAAAATGATGTAAAGAAAAGATGAAAAATGAAHETAVRANKAALENTIATINRKLRAAGDNHAGDYGLCFAFEAKELKLQEQELEFVTSVLNDPMKELKIVTDKLTTRKREHKMLMDKLSSKAKSGKVSPAMKRLLDSATEQKNKLEKWEMIAKQVVRERDASEIKHERMRLEATLSGADDHYRKRMLAQFDMSRAAEAFKGHERVAKKASRPSVMKRLSLW